ncbi:hypothetical protein B0H10DRAFT_1364685 [Mycena sp. CBHHK59/15]|nr:hypothetical protein B0H10DRAFT_1364685 [Mycena sp. CBHHK59/15]
MRHKYMLYHRGRRQRRSSCNSTRGSASASQSGTGPSDIFLFGSPNAAGLFGVPDAAAWLELQGRGLCVRFCMSSSGKPKPAVLSGGRSVSVASCSVHFVYILSGSCASIFVTHVVAGCLGTEGHGSAARGRGIAPNSREIRGRATGEHRQMASGQSDIECGRKSMPTYVPARNRKTSCCHIAGGTRQREAGVLGLGSPSVHLVPALGHVVYFVPSRGWQPRCQRCPVFHERSVFRSLGCWAPDTLGLANVPRWLTAIGFPVQLLCARGLLIRMFSTPTSFSRSSLVRRRERGSSIISRCRCNHSTPVYLHSRP